MIRYDPGYARYYDDTSDYIASLRSKYRGYKPIKDLNPVELYKLIGEAAADPKYRFNVERLTPEARSFHDRRLQEWLDICAEDNTINPGDFFIGQTYRYAWYCVNCQHLQLDQVHPCAVGRARGCDFHNRYCIEDKLGAPCRDGAHDVDGKTPMPFRRYADIIMTRWRQELANPREKK